MKCDQTSFFFDIVLVVYWFANQHEWVWVSLGAPFIRPCAILKQKSFVNYLGALARVMVCQIVLQTSQSEFEFHWMPYSFGLVPHLNKELRKLVQIYLAFSKMPRAPSVFLYKEAPQAPGDKPCPFGEG